MAPVVERVSAIPPLTLGEGPHWDVRSQSLYFVDIYQKAIHKYHPATNKHTSATLEKNASLIVPVKGTKDQFVVNQLDSIAVVTWDGVSKKPNKVEKLADVSVGSENVLNDGKCDALGRLWTGTLGTSSSSGGPLKLKDLKPTGTLYTLHSKKLTSHVNHITISNGLAWNDQLKKFYYIDSWSWGIDEFDFDLASGALSNRKRIYTTKSKDYNEVPDGMTIDSNGNLWVAIFGGSRIIQVDPRRPETLLQTVDLPVKQVTSVAWGGPELDVLYATSAQLELAGQEVSKLPEGALYKITGLGVKGLPANEFVL